MQKIGYLLSTLTREKAKDNSIIVSKKVRENEGA